MSDSVESTSNQNTEASNPRKNRRVYTRRPQNQNMASVQTAPSTSGSSAQAETIHRNGDNIPPYARIPVFPPGQRNSRGSRRGHRGSGRGSHRGGNQNVEERSSASHETGSEIPDLMEISTATKRGGRNRRRGSGSQNRGGNSNRGSGRHDSQPLVPLNEPHQHTFNPDATPFVPSNQVRIVNIVDLPVPPNSRQAKQVRGGSRRNNEPQRRPPRTEKPPQEKKIPASTSQYQQAPRRKPKREENPNAPLRERLKNRLEDNDYECMICCQIITAKQGIWSCKKCYNMFHISGGCIVNWAKKNRQEDANDEWRCPTCQTRYSQIPYNYYCFCGKERNPTLQIGETPHSCGQICSGERGFGCPHPCSEPCHPGPCAECPVMVTQKCNCGRIEKATRCGAGLQISCEQVCNRPLSCGNHSCNKVCHSGDCSPCEEKVIQKCFCEQSEKEVPCHIGNVYDYSCGKPCNGMYNCGKHKCINRCHQTGQDCGVCVSAPERVTHCPCGKYSLSELGEKGVRLSCSDPVPVCESTCNKKLRCGSEEKPHRCRSKCHTGPCPPCDYNSSVVCRCTQVKKTVPCAEYLEILDQGVFLCEKRCKKKKSCGVHRCQEQCCIQDVHICMQVCNKRLSCGLHNCEYLCHSGECVRCLRASFDEQFCHCGRTMRPPPIPCGTSLPECDEPCARPHACNHPVNHKCHSAAVCPPCTFLVERECYGKHELRKNIPCHMEGISCGRECGKELGCGVHTCTRRCHFGDCFKPGEFCTQPCAVIRKACEHPCNVRCHGTADCPETICTFPVTALCECGRRKETMRCIDIEKTKQRLRAVAVENEAEVGEVKEATLKRTRSMENIAVLPCSDECKKVARNKKLAEALSIITNDDGDIDSPTITFTETMKTGLKAYPQLVLELEKIFTKMIELLDDQTNSSNMASYNFAPMHMEKRRLIHEYASYFQLESISVDEVPKRSVIVTGRRGIARPPLILLSDLNKYPAVWKQSGPTTIRHNVNDEIKKAAAAEEDSGMRQLKANRTAYKRMVPTVFVPEPVKQSNLFSALVSDDEQEEEKVEVKPTTPPVGTTPDERDVDWWSDEEDTKPEEESEDAKASNETESEVGKEDTELAVDAVEKKLGELNIPETKEDVKDSWSDVE